MIQYFLFYGLRSLLWESSNSFCLDFTISYISRRHNWWFLRTKVSILGDESSKITFSYPQKLPVLQYFEFDEWINLFWESSNDFYPDFTNSYTSRRWNRQFFRSENANLGLRPHKSFCIASLRYMKRWNTGKTGRTFSKQIYLLNKQTLLGHRHFLWIYKHDFWALSPKIGIFWPQQGTS